MMVKLLFGNSDDAAKTARVTQAELLTFSKCENHMVVPIQRLGFVKDPKLSTHPQMQDKTTVACKVYPHIFGAAGQMRDDAARDQASQLAFIDRMSQAR